MTPDVRYLIHAGVSIQLREVIIMCRLFGEPLL